jgi:uncharacterized protein (DUF1015 family)
MTEKVADRFEVQPIGALGDVTPAKIAVALALAPEPSFALAGFPAGSVSVLTPKGEWRASLPANKSDAWKTLDLVALHALFLAPILGIDVDAEGEGRVRFTRDEPGALAGVANGSLQLAAFLTPPKARVMRKVAEAGDRMPQKSTYFYPKMRTGLVLRGIGRNA